MSDTDIIKGFNQGYELQKYNPELAEKLGKGLKDKNSDYALAFAKGREEWQKERPKEMKFNYNLKKENLPKIEKDKDKEREK